MFHYGVILAAQLLAVVFCVLAITCATNDRDCRRYILCSLAALLVMALLSQSNEQFVFRYFPELKPTGISVWQDTVNKSPQKVRPRINLARSLHLSSKGRPDLRDRALAEYRNALLLSLQLSASDRGIARNLVAMNIGDLMIRSAVELQEAGRFDEAMALVEEGRGIMLQQWNSDPGYPGIAINLGKIFVMVGHAKTLSGNPETIRAGVQEIAMGIAIFDEGLKDGGLSPSRDLDDLEQFSPSSYFPGMSVALLYANKAEAYRLLGQCEQMRENHRLAAVLSPDFQAVPSCEGF